MSTHSFFWFLTGIIFSYAYVRLTYLLAKKVLKRPGQLGYDTRAKFVRDMTDDRLEEFQKIIDRELARRLLT